MPLRFTPWRLAFAGHRAPHLLLVLALLGGLVTVPATTAHAQEATQHMFDNGRLRFGGGGHLAAAPQVRESSIDGFGNLRQPFYWSPDAGRWNKLTYSSYPLDIAVGAGSGGDNWTGSTVVDNPVLSDQVIDSSGFTTTSESDGVAIGYGTMISTGALEVAGAALEVRSTYELGEDASFVKIITRVRNVGADAADNVNLWVGTRDDYVGTSDQPTKTKGNLVDGAFVATPDAATPGAALRITSAADGVLFYSTTEGTNTAVNSCCSFSNAYNQRPTTSATTLTGDGSYALHLPVGSLATDATAEIVWYYAAGPLSALDEVIRQVADASAPPRPAITIGDGQATVTWLPATAEDPIVGYVLRYRAVGADSWIEVRVGAEPPHEHLVTGLVNGTNYEFEVAAVTKASDEAPEVIGEWSPTSEESAPGLPVNETRPEIAGDVRIGQTVSVADGDWRNTRDGDMTASYQWQVDGVDIEGATGTTFEVTAEYVGRRLQVITRRTNDVGRTEAVSRAVTVPAVPLLSGITTSVGTLAPAFVPATTNYTVSVEMATTSLDLRLATATPGATIRVDGTPVASWMPVAVPLRYGRNDVAVQVVGPGGTTSYTISITRPSPTPLPAPKPTTPVPPVVVRDPVGQLPQPGTGHGTVAGQRVTLQVAPNAATRGVDVRGPGFEMKVAPAAGETNPNLPPATHEPGERPAADMTFTRGESAQVAVRGFAARTPVRLWLFSAPKLLGEFETDAAGALAAVSEILGDDVAACRHTVHAEGQLPTGESVELSLGVWVDASPYPYRDVATRSEHARAVACLRDLDVINGTGADTFDPAGDLQRGQAATLVARLLGLPLDGTPDLADAARSSHRGGIAAALEAELLTGFVDRSFRPGASITRGQLASLLAAAAGLDRDVPSAFDDTVTSVHAGAIAVLAQTGIASGFGDGSFRPGQPVSREQAASMLHRFIEWREAQP